LRWFIDNDAPPTGSGPIGLADFCQQVTTYWAQRNTPNVHLFHYQDLWEDLPGEMRRVADSLGVTVAASRWPEFVEAATLESMKSRAAETAPEAHLALWRDTSSFFRLGGNRNWASFLTDSDIAHFHRRLTVLAGDAERWVLAGRAGIRD
jgi:aryl sulfotransferase